MGLIVKFPARGRVSQSALSSQVDTSEMKAILSQLTKITHEPELRSSLEAALRVAESNRCIIDFEELIALQGLGIKVRLTA